MSVCKQWLDRLGVVCNLEFDSVDAQAAAAAARAAAGSVSDTPPYVGHGGCKLKPAGGRLCVRPQHQIAGSMRVPNPIFIDR